MGKTEIIIFLVLANAVFLILIGGIFLFVLKYRKRKLEHKREIQLQEEKYAYELLHVRANVQQQTMEYIGREIHDNVAQKLTLASIYTYQMHNKVVAPDLIKPLEDIIKIINDSLSELRQLSHSLTDGNLQYTSLLRLIEVECKNVNDTGNCKAVLNASEIPELDIAVKSSLLRIVQEFIQNSLKYSGCSLIEIRLTFMAQSLQLSLGDNGRGFDLEEGKHKGIGLDNMRRRVLALGGNFNMVSSDIGTTLHIQIPQHQLKASA